MQKTAILIYIPADFFSLPFGFVLSREWSRRCTCNEKTLASCRIHLHPSGKELAFACFLLNKKQLLFKFPGH